MLKASTRTQTIMAAAAVAEAMPRYVTIRSGRLLKLIRPSTARAIRRRSGYLEVPASRAGRS